MKKQILTDFGIIEVDVRVTRTRKINIRIKEDGSVSVTYSSNIPYERVENFVRQKANWIMYHSKIRGDKFERVQNAEINSIFILGSEYSLVAVAKEQIKSNAFGVKLPSIGSKTSDIYFENGVIYLLGDKEKAVRKLKKKLAEFALAYFKERVEFVKKQYSYKKSIEVAVKNVKSWWGLCSPVENKITFNLRLISRERETIDSVVYHEFAHLKVANHSKKFYDVLLGYCPNYYEQNKKVKESKYDITDKFFRDK